MFDVLPKYMYAMIALHGQQVILYLSIMMPLAPVENPKCAHTSLLVSGWLIYKLLVLQNAKEHLANTLPYTSYVLSHFMELSLGK